jgi:hypothetical protein
MSTHGAGKSPSTPASAFDPKGVFRVPVTVSRHSLLLTAFDHLHTLETKNMDNDERHGQLMEGVAKVVGQDIGTCNLDNMGVHVYSSDESALKAGVINIGTREELIIKLKRDDKRSIICKKRVLKFKPKCSTSAVGGLDMLANAIDLGK